MSKFQELKRELSILEKTFGPRHEHFRVEANGLDEVTYRFLASNGEHVVHCNIYVSQVWFLVSVDKLITISITKNMSKCSNFNVPLVKQESYPNPPPMWFAESDDAKITQIVEFLSCIEPNAPNLVRRLCFPFTFTWLSPEILQRPALCNQRFLYSWQLLRSTKHLVKELYNWQNIPVPSHIDNLDLVQLIHVSSHINLLLDLLISI